MHMCVPDVILLSFRVCSSVVVENLLAAGAAFPFWFTKGAPVNRTVAQHARRAYYAATSFADHLVGRVLDTVDELGYHESTIVMLVGDQCACHVVLQAWLNAAADCGVYVAAAAGNSASVRLKALACCIRGSLRIQKLR